MITNPGSPWANFTVANSSGNARAQANYQTLLATPAAIPTVPTWSIMTNNWATAVIGFRAF
jgi:hypothetical protein